MTLSSRLEAHNLHFTSVSPFVVEDRTPGLLGDEAWKLIGAEAPQVTIARTRAHFRRCQRVHEATANKRDTRHDSPPRFSHFCVD
jgi:hypothetical protein